MCMCVGVCRGEVPTLANLEFEVSVSKTPCIIQLPLVSPGCTLADMTTPLLPTITCSEAKVCKEMGGVWLVGKGCGLPVKSVIVRTGQMFPAKV